MQRELSVCLASLLECVLQFIDIVVGQKVVTPIVCGRPSCSLLTCRRALGWLPSLATGSSAE